MKYIDPPLGQVLQCRGEREEGKEEREGGGRGSKEEGELIRNWIYILDPDPLAALSAPLSEALIAAADAAPRCRAL